MLWSTKYISVKKIHQYHINKQINNIQICYNNYLKSFISRIYNNNYLIDASVVLNFIVLEYKILYYYLI